MNLDVALQRRISKKMARKYNAVITEDVWDFFDENVYSEKVSNKILETIDLLENFPEIGRVYDPEYLAAKPPFACRSIPISDSPFVIYYFISEKDSEVVIFSMQFQRANPNERF